MRPRTRPGPGGEGERVAGLPGAAPASVPAQPSLFPRRAAGLAEPSSLGSASRSPGAPPGALHGGLSLLARAPKVGSGSEADRGEMLAL